MTAEEYHTWLPWIIDGYAKEVAERVGGDPEAAQARSEASMQELLPGGLATPDHVLLIGEEPGVGRIGYLWFGPSSDDPRRAWLYDIFTGGGLNVVAHNDVARHLYESSGYDEVARQMHKDL